jgi:hypothetical protein
VDVHEITKHDRLQNLVEEFLRSIKTSCELMDDKHLELAIIRLRDCDLDIDDVLGSQLDQMGPM